MRLAFVLSCSVALLGTVGTAECSRLGIEMETQR